MPATPPTPTPAAPPSPPPKPAAKKKAYKRGAFLDPRYPELFASDVSINPSYTNLKLPYTLVCEHRIKDNLKLYKKVLRNELQQIQRQHPFAFDGVQLARVFVNGIRKPRRFKDPLKYSERKRVEKLLSED